MSLNSPASDHPANIITGLSEPEQPAPAFESAVIAGQTRNFSGEYEETGLPGAAANLKRQRIWPQTLAVTAGLVAFAVLVGWIMSGMRGNGSSISPQAAEYLLKGQDFNRQKAYQPAITQLNRAIELNPKSGQAYYERGNAYAGLERYSRAAEDYDQAIALNPAEPDYYVKRGDTRANLLQTDLALQDYATAIRLNPASSQAYYERGLLYYRVQDYRRSIDDLDKVLQQSPGYPDAYAHRGQAYNALKYYSLAISDFEKYLQAYPNTPSVRAMLMTAYVQRGRGYAVGNLKEAAAQDFQKAAEMGSDEARTELEKLLQNP